MARQAAIFAWKLRIVVEYPDVLHAGFVLGGDEVWVRLQAGLPDVKVLRLPEFHIGNAVSQKRPLSRGIAPCMDATVLSRATYVHTRLRTWS